MAADPDPEQAASSSMSDEWSTKAIDVVDTVVDVVHDRVVRPALIAGRGVVFGTLIVFVSLVALILLPVALVRLLDVYAFGGRVWASDALFGIIFCAAGFFLWSLRARRHTSDG
jgi:hypothetical protein